MDLADAWEKYSPGIARGVARAIDMVRNSCTIAHSCAAPLRFCPVLGVRLGLGFHLPSLTLALPLRACCGVPQVLAEPLEPGSSHNRKKLLNKL